jgi:hypothetical protein
MNKSRVPSLILQPVLLLLFVLSGLTSRAQLTTNTAILQKASQDRSSQNRALQQILTRTALQKGWPLIIKDKKGRTAYLRGINSRGLPDYISTVDNIISAATISTNQLWAGGRSKLNLNGSSAALKGKIAIWDEGLVRPTHVELAGRVVQVDNSPTLSDHSTHVSGTMIAAGVNPVAKGMAYGAQLLQCYDFDNDESEMMKAAANGLLVSNHSYADIAGWYQDASNNNRWDFWGNPGDTVDIRFGLYDQDTQIWDSIAYNAPYYLIAKAAGNNPGDTGPDAGGTYWRMNAQGTFYNAGPRPKGISNNFGYETIATYGNAKNILCIGAVNPIPGGYTKPSDVVQAGFTSLGPTGDGRIKPDLVADGVNVLSSISTADNAYDIYSGTSMATPASAGSSFLLQQYYSNLHGGVFLRSATLKGLLIHTADEAGSAPGPDYVFGWGLINSEKAASVITSDNTDQSQQIHESSLTNGTKDSETFTITASGKTPVVATISWTDPPAVPVNIPSNESNFQDVGVKLIDDLDLRVKDNTTGTVYMPWVLNPSNRPAAATKGDNIRDNVEKVELSDSLIPGRTYTITVTHKGTLQRGTQQYSLLISGAGGAAVCTSASTSGGADITAINLTNLSNLVPTNGSCPGYVDFTALTPANLPVGQTIPISISTASCNATNNNRIVAVYIDYNNNDTFENNELAYTSAATLTGTVNGSFTVPTTAVVGSYARMRVIAEETTNPAVISPCGAYTNGETQDYRVTFTNPSTDVGVIDLEYPNQTTCSNDSTLVAVRIHNYGTTAQTAGVPVSTVISLSGNIVASFSAICMDSIPAGGEVVYAYSSTLPTTAGKGYTFVSHTALSGDVNTANDTNTTTVTVNPAASGIAGSATICGSNATSVALHANATGDDIPLWYDSETATTPIAAGNNTTTTDIASTYYVALNDLNVHGGSPNALAYASGSASPGFYYPLDGQFMEFSSSVPLTLQSARLYVGHSGQVTFTLATLVSIDPKSGGYSYYPITSTTIDVYATRASQLGRINIGAGQMTDTGGIFELNIPIPNPGNYILIAVCSDTASLFLNSGITTNYYPVSIPGVFAVTGNSNKYDPNNEADSVTYFEKYYFPLYDIGVTLDACPGPRTSVSPSTETGPQISLSGDILTSTADSGNQWYLNDSLLPGKTGVTDTVAFSGVYYTVVTDPTTGCVLTSNKITYTSDGINLKYGPNPTGDKPLNLTFQVKTAANTSVELYNTLGERVYEAQYPDFSGIFSQQINLNYLASGMYVMKIIIGSATYHEKILVTKK